MDDSDRPHAASPIERAIERASHVLPDQGPIGVFIHHNTLHAFQHLPFHVGVQEGARLVGARPYLSLDEFRALFEGGRIEDLDLSVAIARHLGARARDRIGGVIARGDLWRALLLDDLDVDDAAGLAFRRDYASDSGDALLAAAESLVRRSPRAPGPRPTVHRHRDALLALGAHDTDLAVHAELIRLSAVYLDHGQALQAMPRRRAGLLAAVAYLFDAGSPEPAGCPGVRADVRAAAARGDAAGVVIASTLQALGVEAGAIEDYLVHTALALPGWAGMFSRLERHPEEHVGAGEVTLAEFLAVRLLHERRAVEREAARIGVANAWPALHAAADRPVARAPLLDAWLLAGIARRIPLGAEALDALPDSVVAELWTEVGACTRLQRQQLWQEAYEGRYRRQVLDGLSALRDVAAQHPAPAGRPEAQFVFCIDEREESTRRAIEEETGHHETFGVAGFFGVAIDYKGLDDAAPAAHCPVVVTPQHEVHEAPVYTARGWHEVRAGLRARWQSASRSVHQQSRTLSGGAGLSLLLGPFAAMTAIARVLAPRSSLALRDRVRERLVPRPATRLSALRLEDDLATRTADKPVGFACEEAAERVAGLLRNIGLVRRFAPVVVILGHGSTSLNNPHESAHDCGACGGRRGGANARLFADMANRLEVRSAVRARGIDIPADTWFVGALHDTADDSVRYADLEHLPASHAEAFDRANATLQRALGVAAAERARRFDDAPLGLSPAQALRHVQARASHMAQPRPEYGHCTNAACVVGRRSLTRGLHLDRRAFLVSYDPTQDSGDTILERILAAVGPVGAGISLEYFFSSVDNERYGCGTKLPHNVTGLIGVMAGHQSDLRTGLPLQMVELHEPMRLLLIAEATPASLLAVAERQAEVRELVVNEWVQLVSVHPETGAMLRFEGGSFVPYLPSTAPIPRVRHSVEWHGRTRTHVAPAIVTGALSHPPSTLVPPVTRAVTNVA